MKIKLSALLVEKEKPRKRPFEISDALVPGLRVVVHPTGKKTWVMRFRRPAPDSRMAKLTLGPYYPEGAPGGAPRIGGPLSLADARKLGADANHRRAQGEDIIQSIEADRQRRHRAEAGHGDAFPAVARAYVEEHRVRKTGQPPRGWREVARVLGLVYPRGLADPKKVGDQFKLLEGGLAERWSKRGVGEITGQDVHGVIQEAIRHGIPGAEVKNQERSDNRGRKMGDALGGLFKWAMRHRRMAMTANPMLGTYRPGPPAGRDRVLNAAEIKAVWEACDRLVYPFGSIIRLLLLTGCRLREITALEWKELDGGPVRISLPGRRTKNGLPHVVPLAPLAREIIEKAKRVEGSQHVFTITGRSPVSGWTKAKRRLDAAITEKNDGEALPPWRLHDLRRTCATGMAENLKVPPHVVEAALNHVSGARAGVAGVYNRALYLEERTAALARWAAYVEGIVTGKPANVVPLKRPKQAATKVAR